MIYRSAIVLTSWALLALALTLTGSAEDVATSCTHLKHRLHLHRTTILSATHIAGPANVSTPGPCQSRAFVSTSICRIQFTVNTTSTSSIYAEAWLPDTWYGRFLGLGNVGLGGCVDYDDLDYGTSFHFATVASNNGHDGDDGSVFLNHPEVINDFGHRAIHTQAVIGKKIAEAYYGRRHHKSYFLGCSSGGRQGTQEALKYPDDFDGILVGAPGTDWNHLMGWFAEAARFVGAPDSQNSSSFIPQPLWDVVAAEVLKQCDELDGVKDGIITEPDMCEFRPEAIQCTPQKKDGCLTRAQVETLQRIYQPWFGLQGELLYPRYDPGTEANGNALALFNGSIISYARDWYRFVVLNDSSYDFRDFGPKQLAIADRVNPGGISTFNGDLSAFKKRGGKFITFHGRMDQLVPSGNSKRVYNLISRTLNMPSLDSFYRLFLIPGMTHCYGGVGATRFGQGGYLHLITGEGLTPVNASTHNILLAMVDWVENGVAPDTIVGLSAKGEQRVHCRYPQRSVWNGTAFLCQE